jgi:hypothetical protein
MFSALSPNAEPVISSDKIYGGERDGGGGRGETRYK